MKLHFFLFAVISVVLSYQNSVFAQASTKPATQVCLDYVMADFDEALFLQACSHHLRMRGLSTEHEGPLSPDEAFPKWETDRCTSIGFNFGPAMSVISWFKNSKRAIVFYLEGYSVGDAKAIISTIHPKFEKMQAARDILMYDGLIHLEHLYELFPRFRAAMAAQQPASSPQK